MKYEHVFVMAIACITEYCKGNAGGENDEA